MSKITEEMLKLNNEINELEFVTIPFYQKGNWKGIVNFSEKLLFKKKKKLMELWMKNNNYE